jgi:hypothetical protein
MAGTPWRPSALVTTRLEPAAVEWSVKAEPPGGVKVIVEIIV